MSSDTELNLIKSLLAEKIGSNARSLGKNTLLQYVRARMRALKISEIRDYTLHLLESPQELEEFIENVVVPETWFFREKGALEYLTQYVLEKRKQSPESFPMRILCLPCSTGEEAYSIAMAFLDAKIPASSFTIDGVDISKKALIKAESLVFGPNSFRDTETGFRDRYFTKKPIGYILSDKVSERVHFKYGNVLEESFAEPAKIYDVIICRNLLIYFTKEAQKQTFRVFEKLLKPDGLMIVGQAEYDIIRPFPFQALDESKTIYKKKETKQEKVPSKVKEQKTSSSNQAKAEEPLDEDALLFEARQLADKGKLDQAEQLSLAYLSKHGLDAKAYFLLGILQHAAGQDKNAEEFFEKTVFLDPTHYEALIYLSLLYQKQGDKRKADLFHKRAIKVQTPSGKGLK